MNSRSNEDVTMLSQWSARQRGETADDVQRHSTFFGKKRQPATYSDSAGETRRWKSSGATDKGLVPYSARLRERGAAVRNLRFFAYALLIATIFTDCGAAQQQRNVGSAAERTMTVGTVQKEIRVGLSQADVAEALGSPNIVTKDSTNKETWIYDKIASEASYSQRSAYGTILILGMGRSSGTASSTQRTLTVIIKFDPNNKVESFTYHTSKF